MITQILQSTGFRSGIFGCHRSGGIKSGVSWRRRSTVSRARCAECIYKVVLVQQHNLGDVVNSNPYLCTGTS